MVNRFKSKRFRSLFKAISTPIIVSELYTFKILYCNDGAEELLGYKSSLLKERSFRELFGEDSRARVDSLVNVLSESIGEAKLTENDLTIKRRSGRELSVNLTCSRLNYKEDTVLVICLADITKTKKGLIERQRLIEENIKIANLADLGQLSAGLAHELNNPLAIIRGNVDYLNSLLQTNQPISSTQLLESLTPMNKAIDRASQIMRSMLSRVKQQPHKISDISAFKFVEECARQVQTNLWNSQIFFSNKASADHTISCDPVFAEQVLVNLLVNACQALSEHAKENRQLKVSSSLKANMVIIEVWNSGPGIPKEVQKKIFKPLFTTKKEAGTGLGLYLSKSMMHSQGGEIYFKSDDAEGTCFFLEFKNSNLKTAA